MKRITFLAAITFFLVSAGALFAQDNMTAKQAKIADSKSMIVAPEVFQEFATENVGKEIEIQGMVIHVCKHGGKLMFLIGEDPDKRVKITASDKVGVFKPELEGSTVVIRGVVEPIEEEQIPDEEKHEEDADHKNYYHVPQYAVSCMSLRTIDE
jgi:hypothetical protein